MQPQLVATFVLILGIANGAPVIALHTSPIMTVALPLYLRMGFVKAYDVPPIFGVPYAVYTKAL